MDAPIRKRRGLLRGLSFAPDEIAAVMDHTTTWNNDEAASALFGERPTEADAPVVPTHDYLGKYPLFVDESGRQYFDAGGNGNDDRDNSTILSLFVRIPRSETAKQSRNLSTTYDEALDFPRQGQPMKLSLAPSAYPRPCPFSLDGDQIIVVEEEDEKRRRKAPTGLALEVVTYRIESQRRATASVLLSTTDGHTRDEAMKVIRKRSEHNNTIATFLVSVYEVVDASEFLLIVDSLASEYSVR